LGVNEIMKGAIIISPKVPNTVRDPTDRQGQSMTGMKIGVEGGKFDIHSKGPTVTLRHHLSTYSLHVANALQYKSLTTLSEKSATICRTFLRQCGQGLSNRAAAKIITRIAYLYRGTINDDDAINDDDDEEDITVYLQGNRRKV